MSSNNEPVEPPSEVMNNITVPTTPRRATTTSSSGHHHQHQPQQTNKFNARDYSLVFEQAIKDRECSLFFKKFLKKCRSEELIQFYEEYLKYDELFLGLSLVSENQTGGSSNMTTTTTGKRSSTTTVKSEGSSDDTISSVSNSTSGLGFKKFLKGIQKLWIQAQSIINGFIQQGAEHEINIGSLQKLTFSRWQALVDYTPIVFQDVSSNDEEGLLNIYSKLDPNVLFEGLSIAVLQDLKHDQFPRFVRSEMLFNFLQKKGEAYTRAIAINISQGFNVDVRFQPSDLQSKIIDEKMIYFGFSLMSDTPDWEIILDKDDIQGYVSKTSYFFGKESSSTNNSTEKKGLRLHKSLYTLPFCIDNVWKMVCNQENHLKFDPKANEEFRLRNFEEPNKDSIFAVTETEMGPKFLPIMKRRHFPFITTTFYDSFLKGYVIVCRSFDDSDNHVNRIHYDGFAYTIYIPNGDKATNVFMIDYSDVKLPFKSAFLENATYKLHLPTVQKGMVKVLNELTENNTKNVEWNDSMDGRCWWKMTELHKKLYPNKSWYREWLNK